MPTPFPHQIEGAKFLAQRKAALLADEPRVGKTGAAIMACDMVFARRILVITTASGRANWGREFREWTKGFNVQIVYSTNARIEADADVVIVGWPTLSLLSRLRERAWDVVILDESHYAKNSEAKRTEALYGALRDDGIHLDTQRAVIDFSRVERVWPLSGTPAPNAPNDLYPTLRALAPERLRADTARGWPDVTRRSAFTHRYCVVVPRFINGRRVEVVKGGKNIEELRARLDGFWLRRTQQDVGIREPIYSVLPLHVSRVPPELRADLDAAEAILAAAEAGETQSLEMHLGPIRRITGQLMAVAAADAAAEMLDDGLDRLVLMAWHTDAIDVLRHKLARFGVVGIDGRTPATARQGQVDRFQRGDARVFVGQMQAAGEAIDLSASAELWFVEKSFVPKDMSQAALRITNHSQKRQALVRVCAMEGSIDEALTAILTRKVQTIRQLMEN